MTVRCGSLLLLAAGLYGQEYAASDDGRIAYFSNRPVVGPIDEGRRLWAWSNGTIWTVIDTPKEPVVHLRALSADGQTVLVSYGSTESPAKWEILRHGATAPLLELPAGVKISMNRTGTWLAVKRTSPRLSITRMAITNTGIWPAGVLEDPALADNRFSIAENGDVHFSCNIAKYYCTWDVGTTGIAPLPGYIPPGNSGRYLYYWDDADSIFVPFTQTLQRLDRRDGTTVPLAAQCPKRFVRSQIVPNSTWYTSQAEVTGTDVSGQRMRYSCGNETAVFDVSTGTSTAVPRDGLLNSSLTRLLSRPSPSAFAWAPLDKPVNPLDGPDTILFQGPLNGRGLLMFAGEPDFAIEWGGQKLPWIRGSNGASYAVMPADVVVGSVDTVSISAPKRPWLDYSAKVPVRGAWPAVSPPVAADTLIEFSHEDYRGFVTPNSWARRGEYLHLLVTGIDPAEAVPVGEMRATFWTYPNVQNGLRNPYTVLFPVVAVTPTTYHPYISQVTIYVPENVRANGADVEYGSFSLEMRTPGGSTIQSLEFYAYLRY